jgi:hypothetical protein
MLPAPDDVDTSETSEVEEILPVVVIEPFPVRSTEPAEAVIAPVEIPALAAVREKDPSEVGASVIVEAE